MEAVLSQLITTVSPAALPLVVVIVAGIYFYFKFKGIEQDREVTKVNRDADSQALHDDVLKMKFEITSLQGIVNLHKDKLDSIDKQLGIVNQELVKLNIQVEQLTKALERQNEIMMEQLKK